MDSLTLSLFFDYFVYKYISFVLFMHHKSQEELFFIAAHQGYNILFSFCLRSKIDFPTLCLNSSLGICMEAFVHSLVCAWYV